LLVERNLETTFRGFELYIDPNDPTKFYCDCDYDLPAFKNDESTPFPYQFLVDEFNADTII
jgi:hypothetical protein